jgi:predicted nucleic acid-binding protein
MAGEPFLVDTNVLIRWVQRDDRSYPIVRAAVGKLMRSNSDPCYVSQNLGELWNVLTRPADRNGYGLTPEQAEVRARDIEDAFLLLPDSLAVHQEWRRLPRDYRVSGVQVHDARLVAAMHVHGVSRILTFNVRDFDRYKDVEAIHP